MKFENFQEAYLHNMKNVYLTPEFINEPRGNKSKEVLNLSFVIENPIERVCYLPSRKTTLYLILRKHYGICLVKMI